MSEYTKHIAIGSAALLLGVLPSACKDDPPAPPAQSVDAGPIVLPTPDASTPVTPTDSGQPVQTCVPPTKGPTKHPGSINADETWTADGSPHLLESDVSIYKTVTIEPCAEVLIAGLKTVTVSGKLVAEGTAAKPIKIGAQDVAKPYAAIRISRGATARFAHATISGGGDKLNGLPYNTGMIDLQGDVDQPVQESLFVDTVTIDGSTSNGLVLRDNAGFATGSKDLTIKGSAEHPMNIFARAMGGIPVGTYTGNGKDQILFPTTARNETVDVTTTMHDRGVPYLVGSPQSDASMRVDAGPNKPPAVLTIEPGVKIQFKKASTSGLFMVFSTGTAPAPGAIVAVGTADKPIIFTSGEATPAAGDWLGLRFGQVPIAANKIEHVRIEYAGALSQTGSDSCPDAALPANNDAAIRIYGTPPSQFITNTTIFQSASHGIDRGYRSDTTVDFLATNTFTNVVECNQTLNKTMTGGCPAPTAVPCPK